MLFEANCAENCASIMYQCLHTKQFCHIFTPVDQLFLQYPALRCTFTLFNDSLRHFFVWKNNGGRASFQAKRAQLVSCLSIVIVYIVLCSEIYATAPESLASLERSSDQDNSRSIRGAPQACFGFHEFSPTMIHSGTLCIQRKVTKLPCFGGIVFRAQFQYFLSAFWRPFFAMQLALVSMITITPTLSLSVFSLQRTRLFRTCGELWRTCGELWLYFEMQRRLDLWSFSWSSRRSREAQK